jgi:hypothetical protein
MLLCVDERTQALQDVQVQLNVEENVEVIVPIGTPTYDNMDVVVIPGDGLCYAGAPLAHHLGRVASRSECDAFVKQICEYILKNANLPIPELDDIPYGEYVTETVENDMQQLCRDLGTAKLSKQEYLSKLQERDEDDRVVLWGDYSIIGWAISSILNVRLMVHVNDAGVLGEYFPLSESGCRRKDCHVWHTGTGTPYEHYNLLTELKYESENELEKGGSPGLGAPTELDDVLNFTLPAQAIPDTATATPPGSLPIVPHFQCCYISCTERIGGEDKLGKSCTSCAKAHLKSTNATLECFTVPLFCPQHIQHKHHKLGLSYSLRPEFALTIPPPPIPATPSPIPAIIKKRPIKATQPRVVEPRPTRDKRKVQLSQEY